jgi:hypothetical protein
MKLRTLVAASCVLAAVPAFGELTITSVVRQTRADWSLSGAFPITLPPVIETDTTTSGPWSSNISQGISSANFAGAAQTSDVSPTHITFAGSTSWGRTMTPSMTDLIAQSYSLISIGFHVDASTPIHAEVQCPPGNPLVDTQIPGNQGLPGLFLKQGSTNIILRYVGDGGPSAFDRVLAPGDYTLRGLSAFGFFGRVFSDAPPSSWFLNFTFDAVPAPASAVVLLPLLGLASRRRRS